MMGCMLAISPGIAILMTIMTTVGTILDVNGPLKRQFQSVSESVATILFRM